MDSRDAAYRHLSAQASRFPDLLPSDVQTGSLDARDSALAHAIVDAAITRWLTLEHILSELGGRALREQEPRMQGVLLGGAAQLLLLDRLPAHAVLDESVEWAKRNIRPRAGGMVNAILRKVARATGDGVGRWNERIDAIPLSDGTALVLRGVRLPDDDRHRLAIACSLPGALLRRWEETSRDSAAAAMHTLFRAPTLLYVKHARTALPEGLASEHESAEHRVFEGTRQELIALLGSRRDIWVQDPASSATLDRLKLEKPPARVVDLCAGQGTKTRQLRAMFPGAEIIACEVDAKRLATLREQFGDDGAVRIFDAVGIPKELSGAADLVLADVPCSNTGVLARRREARYRPLKSQLRRLVPLQQQILLTARDLLTPGGSLLYSTCSRETEENEAMARWASAELGLELLDAHRVEPHGQPQEPARVYQDGSFSALLSAS